MKALTRLLPLVLCFAAACSSTQTSTSTSTTLPEGEWIGQAEPFTEVVMFSAVNDAPDEYYDRTLFVEATVTAVCKKKGCWMQIEDQEQTAVVRWETGCGGQYKFPMEAIGQRVVIQGSVYPKQLTEAEVASITAESSSDDLELDTDGYEFNASAVLLIED